jgi:hypothetical protein
MSDTIESLLSRAAELAPEWCEISPNAIYVGTSPDWFMLDLTPTNDNRARILYAVLQECERRGLRFGVSCTDGAWSGYIFPEPPQDPMEPWVAMHENDSDPAVAILSAFVALLEAEQEVKA